MPAIERSASRWTARDVATLRAVTAEPPHDQDSFGDKAKAAIGCGLQSILIWVGVIIVFALIFGVGLWIFDALTN